MFLGKGIYYLNITAFNHLTNKTTSVSGKNWNSSLPFIFYADRHPAPLIFSEKEYTAEVGKPKLLILDSADAALDPIIEWEIDDVVKQTKGIAITHIFKNEKKYEVSATTSNRIGSSKVSVTVVAAKRLRGIQLHFLVTIFLILNPFI